MNQEDILSSNNNPAARNKPFITIPSMDKIRMPLVWYQRFRALRSPKILKSKPIMDNGRVVKMAKNGEINQLARVNTNMDMPRMAIPAPSPEASLSFVESKVVNGSYPSAEAVVHVAEDTGVEKLTNRIKGITCFIKPIK
jgi:hypothetical protein